MKIKISPNFINIIFILIIISIVIFSYWGIQHHQFLNFDDDMYVLSNQYVKNGVSWENIKWAFGFDKVGYWHPLAYISLMLDCHFFGLKSGHLLIINLLLHVFNAIILYLLLFKMTGARFKAAMVSLLFAIHPLNVESVAWLAERKTVLSAFFMLAAIYTYIIYAKMKRKWLYLLVIFFYAFGLMTKPAILIFPLLLIILDYWPLQRIKNINLELSNKKVLFFTTLDKFISFLRKNKVVIIYEKIPFIILSILSVIVSLLSMHSNKEVIHYDIIPLYIRIANFFISILEYLKLILWPVKLSIFYPFSQTIGFWHFLFALVFAVSTTILAIYLRERKPWFLVGWCWFMVALMPASGIIQAGLWPAIANRFMYLPLIGFFVIVVWELDKTLKGRYSDLLKIILCVAVICYFAALTRIQKTYYSNSYSLFKRSLDIIQDNALGLNNIAVHLTSLGRHDEAVQYLDRALLLYPERAGFYHNYGVALASKGEENKATAYFKKAIALDQKIYGAYVNLGLIESHRGNNKQALSLLSKAMEIKPDNLNVRNNYGSILLKLKRYKEAILHFMYVLNADRENIPARLNLASAYQGVGSYHEALEEYEVLKKLDVDGIGRIHYSIASVYSQLQQYKECKNQLQVALKEGFNVYDHLTTDERFKNFRTTSYYKELLKEKNKMEDQKKR